MPTVTNGESYSYYVKALNDFGPGDPSNTVIGTPVSFPSAPTNFTVASLVNEQISLSWEAPSAGGAVA